MFRWYPRTLCILAILFSATFNSGDGALFGPSISVIMSSALCWCRLRPVPTLCEWLRNGLFRSIGRGYFASYSAWSMSSSPNRSAIKIIGNQQREKSFQATMSIGWRVRYNLLQKNKLVCGSDEHNHSSATFRECGTWNAGFRNALLLFSSAERQGKMVPDVHARIYADYLDWEQGWNFTVSFLEMEWLQMNRLGLCSRSRIP